MCVYCCCAFTRSCVFQMSSVLRYIEVAEIVNNLYKPCMQLSKVENQALQQAEIDRVYLGYQRELHKDECLRSRPREKQEMGLHDAASWRDLPHCQRYNIRWRAGRTEQSRASSWSVRFNISRGKDIKSTSQEICWQGPNSCRHFVRLPAGSKGLCRLYPLHVQERHVIHPSRTPQGTEKRQIWCKRCLTLRGNSVARARSFNSKPPMNAFKQKLFELDFNFPEMLAKGAYQTQRMARARPSPRPSRK